MVAWTVEEHGAVDEQGADDGRSIAHAGIDDQWSAAPTRSGEEWAAGSELNCCADALPPP
ncbi:hypothetical protein E2562_012879 [Oryza meyeriana var. granulata]|uniref:Uncharacterized protein n=1 Tax=Oryza meyeriana var. granulata TaxID=110450 RepID=A0A6G1CPW8_9ORYZ|nr:hypothetical protein E2562_012879 [Oryza meyeriana var. granulata]